MNAAIFAALLRKDWRVYRAPIWATAGFGAVLYAARVAASPSIVWDALTGEPGQRFSALNWAHPISDAAIVGVLATTVLAPAFGGMAFAAERRERSAEFLARLPVGRGAVAASKAVVAAACLVAAFAVHYLLGGWASRVLVSPGGPPTWPFEHAAMVVVISTAAMLFGIAWLLSAFMGSAAISASAAIAVVAVTAVSFGQARVLVRHDAATIWAATACGTAAAAVVAGSIGFARRVGP